MSLPKSVILIRHEFNLESAMIELIYIQWGEE
jgi:hypothetical protein